MREIYVVTRVMYTSSELTKYIDVYPIQKPNRELANKPAPLTIFSLDMTEYLLTKRLTKCRVRQSEDNDSVIETNERGTSWGRKKKKKKKLQSV